MPPNASKYETLLKKNCLDDLLKNWGLTVSAYLDDFMSHMNESTEQMNFSEAAMLLQSSTTLYCKRVDVVHKIIQELVVEVQKLRSDEDVEKNDRNTKKKKKTTNRLLSTEFEVLDFVPSDSSIDTSIDKLTGRCAPQQIVLSSSIKALRKGKTSVVVYQANGNMLGCKEEFRIFGKTYSDGTVNDDFNDNEERIINRVEDDEIGNSDLENLETLSHEDLRDDSFQMDMEVDPIPPVVEPELSTQVPEKTDLSVSPSLPVAAKESRAAVRPRRGKLAADWEPVPHDIKLTLKPLKSHNRCLIPANVEKDDSIQILIKGGERKRKAKKEEEERILLTWIDMALMEKSAMKHRISCELKAREALSKSRIQSKKPTPPEVQVDYVDDDEMDHDDFECLVNDNEAAEMRLAPLSLVDRTGNDNHSTYIDEAMKAIEKFKEKRREYACRATEVAKRVAMWHEAILPILEAGESRSKFDVHEYGSRILSYFPDDDHETFRSFKTVVVEQPKVEVCRFLLSTLMLANTYNLEIKKSDPNPLAKDCLELRLITKVRHHEEMDEALRVASEDCGS